MEQYKSTFDANPQAEVLYVSVDGNIFLSKKHAESYKRVSKNDYKEVSKNAKIEEPKKVEVKTSKNKKSKNK
mgnify:CR=1 FL=1|tara:strand:+ start:4255 stop:4470 length:216 start_codon:yes stop_codon:yes gene_type:complete